MLNFAANKSDHIDEIAQGQLKVINFFCPKLQYPS